MNGRGGGEALSSCNECADLCNSNDGCLSYECSEGSVAGFYFCNLNSQRYPGCNDRYEYYYFCSRRNDMYYYPMEYIQFYENANFYYRKPGRQCAADISDDTDYPAEDEWDNPLIDGTDELTLEQCLDECDSHKESDHHRYCLAVEWYDGGKLWPSDTTKSCALAWGCDYTRDDNLDATSVYGMQHGDMFIHVSVRLTN